MKETALFWTNIKTEGGIMVCCVHTGNCDCSTVHYYNKRSVLVLQDRYRNRVYSVQYYSSSRFPLYLTWYYSTSTRYRLICMTYFY